MYLIGLTGGIASGKSVVAARLASHGAVHIDADVIARQVVEPGTPGLEAIRREFGEAVITAEGTLDRPALGAIVFADEERRLALNAITHPAVWRRVKELIADAAADDPHAVIVYDVPLLAEGRAERQLEFDLIAVVHAPAPTRVQRMVELRGMARDEAERRIRAQIDDDARLAIADVVIDSSGTLEHTLEQADDLWRRARAAA
ncbi:dephospho-CoA kinase [Desertivibrio insolitus]|uniref:dephospho-CoA kinase n=1 Tax=Herbiconiux sp. SYSU D00978 TaxID=2812562 RepID=UPI001A97361C|nr:dephospho-CoA kinase [Herbiconiux sp. SYSU D00978]